MKSLFTAFLITVSISVFGQKKDASQPAPDKNKKLMLVEASCGQCQFSLPGKSCDLAVRIDGKAYFVDGSNIDSHGDAHAKDGFCNAVRNARVQGEIIDGRFKASYFKVLNEEPKKVTSKPAPAKP